MNPIELYMFEYNKKSKRLSIASELFGQPKEVDIVSHLTGKHVKFIFDRMGAEDSAIYKPVGPCKVVELVVYHAW